MDAPSLKEAQAVAREIRNQTEKLNLVITTATVAGIKVELEAREVQTIGQPTRPVLTVTPRIDPNILREE